ncbi:MAG: transposase [Planctomycetaceae bacterium]
MATCFIRPATTGPHTACWRHRQDGQLSSHKREGVKDAIEAAGANVMDLPPYSPDLNPIELAFSKLKTLLRKSAARTVESL